jgi:hypothetical protein
MIVLGKLPTGQLTHSRVCVKGDQHWIHRNAALTPAAQVIVDRGRRDIGGPHPPRRLERGQAPARPRPLTE